MAQCDWDPISNMYLPLPRVFNFDYFSKKLPESYSKLGYICHIYIKRDIS
jgi:hypothetical protein